MNCPNCGRPMNTAHECVHCASNRSYAAPMYLPPHNHNDMHASTVWYDRHTVALESIAESLRNLPSKRELLAAILKAGARASRGAAIDTTNGIEIADAIIAACKESEPTKGDAK